MDKEEKKKLLSDEWVQSVNEQVCLLVRVWPTFDASKDGFISFDQR